MTQFHCEYTHMKSPSVAYVK